MTTFQRLSPTVLAVRNYCILIAAIAVALARPVLADVELHFELDREFYPYLTESQFYTQARIQTRQQNDGTPRPTVNLSILIDRSGSMGGDRILNVKAAAIASREALSDDDILSLVTFGSQAETPIPAQRADRLETLAFKVESIKASGGAALYDGLNQAAAQLRRYQTETSVNRILLVTDGPPTRGPRETSDFAALARSFANERITIDAIGIGNDSPEKLLETLTRETGGGFEIVADESTLTTASQQAIHALKTPIARDVHLDVVYRSRLEIDEQYASRATIDGRRLRFQWDYLYENQTISAIVSGLIRASEADDPFGKLAEATLTYTPMGTERSEPVTLTQSVKAQFIDSRSTSFETINRPVLRAALAQEIAVSVQDAIAFSNQGRNNRAVREIRSSLNALKSINLDLEDDLLIDQIQDLQQVYDRFNSPETSQIEESVLSDIIPAAPQ